MVSLPSEVLDFVLVFVCAACVASAIGALYATGVRLWIRAEDVEDERLQAASATGGARIAGHSRAFVFARVGAALCFALCAAIVLFALWLIIPIFH